MNMHDADDIAKLKGPIVVLGASGFVGANLFRWIAAHRNDVIGTYWSEPGWRLEQVARNSLLRIDIASSLDRERLVELQPATMFDCTAYGAYSSQTDFERIYATNVVARAHLLETLASSAIDAFISAGSSSEYGWNSDGPDVASALQPNSHYAVSKAAAGHLIALYGKTRRFPGLHLRLYSVYGPWEDPTRLIPRLASAALSGRLPPLADPTTARDFIHVDDVCRSFVAAAIHLSPSLYGRMYNVGTGEQTTLRELATLTVERFGLACEPEFDSYPPRAWDLSSWRADTASTKQDLAWAPTVSLGDGLAATVDWWRDHGQPPKSTSTEPSRKSLSIIIACYRDGQAIPIMHERLTKTLRELTDDYEIIFVNDGSPDETTSRLEEITRNDERVVGICHSRNFGSQNAFRSGMQVSTKDACVLLDGDLQDPPELIPQFFEKWQQGYDVVYGERVKREMPWYQHVFHKAFYRVFQKFSYIQVPLDAGDFSLIDRKVVQWMLAFGERDIFLRGIRSYVGFKQVGVPYVRPERMFGRSTNSFLKNIGWAKKGILSFSYLPLNVLTFASVTLFFVMLVTMVVVVALRVFVPDSAPSGLTTLLLGILFFGVVNLVGLGIIGEYVGKIVEETKARPPFIRAGRIKNGIFRAEDE